MSQPALPLQISPELGAWLQTEQLSLGLSTYQTNRLMLVGSNREGKLAISERLFDKPMGLFVRGESLHMSTRYQIWRLDNCLQPGETYQGADHLYRPSQSQIMGGLNVHDLVLDQTGSLIFVNTDYSCLATLEEGHSFKPLWQPPFIKKLVSQDSCHLNGLALVDGKPRYMTACGDSDQPASWRNQRQNGGIVIDLLTSEIIATGLSMPHSPRWYDGKLWLLNSGTGELGYIDAEQFVPVTFCPGFVRGLSFWKHWAIAGLSHLRSSNFTGLALEDRLNQIGEAAQCGVMVIDLRTGKRVHSLMFNQTIEELYDVVVIPGVTQPKAIGFQDEDIERLITFPGCQGLITTKPAVKRPSLGPTAPIPGLPTRERLEQEKAEAGLMQALEKTANVLQGPVKYQRVYHLNPESLAPYDSMTFPSLQQRWHRQPPRGELIGVSASRSGDLVGFVIAEQLSADRVEIISLNVEPTQRRQGIATGMLITLEQQLVKEGITHIGLIYPALAAVMDVTEPLLQKLGWSSPKLLNPQTKRSEKILGGIAQTPSPSVFPALSEPLKKTFQAAKHLVQAQQLEAAAHQFQSVLEQQPDYLPALNQLGNVWQQLGDFEKAIACYQQGLEGYPQEARLHCNLGSLWQQQGKLTPAIDAYQQAIRYQPNLWIAYQNLVGLYNHTGQFATAAELIQQALRQHPQAAPLHLYIGRYLSSMGQSVWGDRRLSGSHSLGRAIRQCLSEFGRHVDDGQSSGRGQSVF